jgi:hypothetical protein
VHHTSLLVGNFHVEVFIIHSRIVIQKLSRDMRCLLDGIAKIGELITLLVARPRSIKHMKKIARHRNGTYQNGAMLALGKVFSMTRKRL